LKDSVKGVERAAVLGHLKSSDKHGAQAGEDEENDIEPRKFPRLSRDSKLDCRVKTTTHETLTPGVPGLQRLQVLAGLKADSLSGRDIYLRSGARVSSDSCLARFYRKDTEAPQLNSIVGFQGVLHAIEDGIDRLFGFGLADACALDDLIYKIQFDH